MKIIKCETVVVTKISKITAMITAIMIRFDKVHYELTYFDGLEQRVIWMHEKEFTTESDKTQTIGFKKYKN